MAFLSDGAGQFFEMIQSAGSFSDKSVWKKKDVNPGDPDPDPDLYLYPNP